MVHYYNDHDPHLRRLKCVLVSVCDQYTIYATQISLPDDNRQSVKVKATDIKDGHYLEIFCGRGQWPCVSIGSSFAIVLLILVSYL